MKEWLKKKRRKVALLLLAAAMLAAAFWYGGNAPGLQGWSAKAPVSAQTSETPAEAGTTPSPEDETTGQSTQTSETTTQVETEPAKTDAEKPLKTGAQTKSAPRPGKAEGRMSTEEKLAAAARLAEESGASSGVQKGDKQYSEDNGMVLNPSTGKDQYLTDPVPEGKPLPVEPQDVVITDKELTCTLSISCATILDNPDWLDPEKSELVPEDGWILKPTAVTFYEGESVFHVLLRVCKQQKIHMEYENTPMYNSAYIEGVHNLYEFDCGELSGWMYRVNGWFPNYGCSRYQLKEGDEINWVYTCDLGIDVGGYFAAMGS